MPFNCCNTVLRRWLGFVHRVFSSIFRPTASSSTSCAASSSFVHCHSNTNRVRIWLFVLLWVYSAVVRESVLHGEYVLTRVLISSERTKDDGFRITRLRLCSSPRYSAPHSEAWLVVFAVSTYGRALTYMFGCACWHVRFESKIHELISVPPSVEHADVRLR